MLTLAILGSAAVLDERVLGLRGREERKRSHLKNHHCLALGVESYGTSRRSKGAPSSSPHFSKQSHPIIFTRFMWVTSFSNAMQPKCSLRPRCRLTPRNPSQPLNPFCLNYTTAASSRTAIRSSEPSPSLSNIWYENCSIASLQGIMCTWSCRSSPR